MIKLTTKTTGELLLVGTLGALLVLSAPGRIVAVEPDAAIAPAPPALVTPPVASGTLRIGQVLSSSDGVWTDATSWSYQWMRDGVPITGEVAATYTVVAADIAALITCEVTATGPGGTSAPEASNALVSVWRPILLVRPGVLIWDGQDPYCYGGAAVGAPVQYLYTVNGILLGEQPLLANRATRLSAGQLDFDDLDDYYDCPSDVVAYMHVDTTVCIHVSGLSSSTGQMLYYALLSSPTVRFGRVAASSSTSRNDHRTNAANTIMVGPATFTQDITVIYAAQPNLAIYDLTSGVTLHTTATGTRSTGSGGTLRIGADPSLSQTFGGAIRGLVLDNSAWDTTTMAIYRDCALAAGVM